MKKTSSCKAIVLLTFCANLLIACGSNDAANAENKDTVSTYIEPKPDNATVRPDTMKTQLPPDSTPAKKR